MMKAHGEYENEVEKPSVPKMGKLMKGMGCHDFKEAADEIAYGQAGMSGCKEDASKIKSQFCISNYKSDIWRAERGRRGRS